MERFRDITINDVKFTSFSEAVEYAEGLSGRLEVEIDTNKTTYNRSLDKEEAIEWIKDFKEGL